MVVCFRVCVAVCCSDVSCQDVKSSYHRPVMALFEAPSLLVWFSVLRWVAVCCSVFVAVCCSYVSFQNVKSSDYRSVPALFEAPSLLV